MTVKQHTAQKTVRVLQQVLPPTLEQAVRCEAEGLALSPNYWMSKADIESSGQGLPAAEIAIQHLHTYVASALSPAFAGVEYWVQIYKPGKGLDFHFDKDESLMKDHSRMCCPYLSSILYLSGSAHHSALGPTVIINQRYNNETKAALPEHPDECTFVWPQANSFAIFDGSLGHGVLESSTQSIRMTLLAVLKRPVETGKLPHDPIQHTCNKEWPDRKGLGKEVEIISIQVPGGPESHALTVDELLHRNGLEVLGKGAIQAVKFLHNGFQLYPVSSEETEQFQCLQTAAAFVSSDLLDCDSENDT